MRFTDTGIRALKSSDKAYVEWGDGLPGFGLRVSPKGKKTWIFMYRFEGRSRMMTLGHFPAMGLATARKAYSDFQDRLAQGNDPGAEAAGERKKEREAETVSVLVSEYLEKWAKRRKKSWQEDERALNKEVVPIWGDRKAKDISKRDVLKLLDNIVDRGSPIQANRTLALVRRMFNFAIERDIVDISPCYRVKAPAPENQCDRMLTVEEIRSFWLMLDSDKAGITPMMREFLRFMLITAQRKGEVLALRWSDIDMEEMIWTIPAEIAKNGLSHRVPLSAAAVAILGKAKAIAISPRLRRGKRFTPELPDEVFYSPRGKGPLSDTSISHAISRNLDAFELASFTPHDLRRTAASHMTGMGIPRLVVSKILNHVETGVTAVYDRHAYDAEKRQALEAWGKRIDGIVSGASAPDSPRTSPCPEQSHP
jgi:integrase